MGELYVVRNGIERFGLIMYMCIRVEERVKRVRAILPALVTLLDEFFISGCGEAADDNATLNSV